MNDEHIVSSFDEDLNNIASLILEMGGLVEVQISDARTALLSRDPNLAEQVVSKDSGVDKLETAIDNAAVGLIAKRQPVARDLRTVVVAPKIAHNLERMGDLAKNIAKRTLVLARSQPITAPNNTIGRMCDMVQQMTNQVLGAYVKRDTVVAEQVRQRDEEVDYMHNALFRELLTYIMEDPRAITPCMHLLFIAKNIERIGDHTTNIADQIHFMVHGEVPEQERPKSDDTSSTMIENEIEPR